MRGLEILALSLLIIGGLNWGLVALANFDLVAFITGAGQFGNVNGLGRLIYGLVGLAAVFEAFALPAQLRRGARATSAPRVADSKDDWPDRRRGAA